MSEKRCTEYFDKLPTTSEHLFQGDIHGIPSGNCLKCGESIQSYNDRWSVAVAELQKAGMVLGLGEGRLQK